MVCRGLLLMLHRTGEIELPAIRFRPRNPLAERERPAPMLTDTTPMTAPLNELRPIDLQQVRRTGDEALFNSLMEHHHYLGYEQPVGEHLKYLVWAQGQAHCVSGVEFGAAPSGQPRPLHRLEHGSPAAQYPLDRLQHAVPDSALGKNAASGFAYSQPRGPTISRDWERMYGHPV